MVVSIEQHVEWIADCLALPARARRRHDRGRRSRPQDAWVEHVNEVADATLYPARELLVPRAPTSPASRACSCPTSAASAPTAQKCDEVAANGYEGFVLSSSHTPAAACRPEGGGGADAGGVRARPRMAVLAQPKPPWRGATSEAVADALIRHQGRLPSFGRPDGRSSQAHRASASNAAAAGRRQRHPQRQRRPVEHAPAREHRAARPGPAGPQLRAGRAVRARARAVGARPLQPDVPRSRSTPNNVERDLDAGRDGQRRVQEGGQVPAGRQRQGGDELRRREIPTFANTDELSKLLQDHNVTIEAEPINAGPRLPAQPDPRLRPGDPARRPVRVARRARRGRRADGRARRVRPLARAPGRGRPTTGHVQATSPASTRPRPS